MKNKFQSGGDARPRESSALRGVGSGQSFGSGPRLSFHFRWLLRGLCEGSHDALWAPTVNLELSSCQRNQYKSRWLCFTTDDASESFMCVCAWAYKVLRYPCNSLWTAIYHRQQMQNITFKNKRDIEMHLLHFYLNPPQCQMSSHWSYCVDTPHRSPEKLGALVQQLNKPY